jgi:phosphatidyl-myo-inositol dimannoside synthase
MNILLVSSQDYIHHPVPSRHHNIFEEMSKHHKIYVAHFHVSRGKERDTNLIVKEATLFSSTNPLVHYIINAPYHFYILDKIIQENKIDVVVTANILASTAAIYVAHKNHIPVVYDVKDWFPDSAAAYFKNPILKYIIKSCASMITKYNLQHCDKIVTVSPSLVNKIRKFVYRDPVLITNGVNVDLFKPIDGSTTRKELDIQQDDFVIGFAGSMENWYDIKALILVMPEIIRYNPHIKLLLVGGSLFTGYDGVLKRLVKDLGITDNVLFTGLQIYKDLPKFISCMDVCVIPPSPAWWREIALPNKYFEYTACGKPILMNPNPDIEKIQEGNCFLYRDIEGYKRLIKLFTRYQLPKVDIDMSKYSWKEKCKEFEKILMDVM